MSRRQHSSTDAENPVIADAAELVQIVAGKYPGDRGLLVAFVMNLVHLAPGESAFTPDGQVHAYVSGTAIELMNPSDNVMRARSDRKAHRHRGAH